MKKNKKLEFLPDDLNKEYNYIELIASEYTAPYMLNKPRMPNKTLRENNKYICTFYDCDVLVSDIIKKIGELPDKDYNNYFLHYNYNEFNGKEIELVRSGLVKNMKYEPQLNKYEENIRIYDEEKKLFPKILKLWKVWAKNKINKNRINQFNHLKKMLEKDGLLE